MIGPRTRNCGAPAPLALEELDLVEPRPEVGHRRHPEEEIGARRAREQVGFLEGDLLAVALLPLPAQPHERGAAHPTTGGRSLEKRDLDGPIASASCAQRL